MNNAAEHKDTRLRNIEALRTKAQLSNVVRLVMVKDIFHISLGKAMQG